jgi:trans-aconitate methyltransferase
VGLTDAEAASSAPTVEHIRCPLCLGRIVQRYAGVRDRLETTARRFAIAECEHCGSGFLNPMPLGDLDSHYPHAYLSGVDRPRRFDPERWYRRNQYRFDMRLVEQATKRDINSFSSYIDIGCGTGERVRYAHDVGIARASGVDRFDFAKPAARADIQLVNSSIEEFRPDDRFELASMFHVLEHVEQPAQTLHHVAAHVVLPGGVLVVQVPNYASLERRAFGARWAGLDAPRHRWDFSEQAVVRLLEAAGFRVQATYKRNAVLHPVTIVPSLSPSLDVQRIWVTQQAHPIRKQLLLAGWAALSLLSVPISLVQNLLGRASMLTVIAVLESHDQR